MGTIPHLPPLAVRIDAFLFKFGHPSTSRAAINFFLSAQVAVATLFPAVCCKNARTSPTNSFFHAPSSSTVPTPLFFTPRCGLGTLELAMLSG
ncbi:hypothetical protein EJB05_26413, partial [Eragrostis curvula]